MNILLDHHFNPNHRGVSYSNRDNVHAVEMSFIEMIVSNNVEKLIDVFNNNRVLSMEKNESNDELVIASKNRNNNASAFLIESAPLVALAKSAKV